MLKGRMAKTIDYQGASDAQLWSMTFPAQIICSASHQQCYLLTVKIIVFSLLRLSASIMVFVYRCFYCPWTFNSLFVPSVLLTTCQTNVMMFTYRALERTVVKCYSLWQLLDVLLWKYICHVHAGSLHWNNRKRNLYNSTAVRFRKPNWDTGKFGISLYYDFF